MRRILATAANFFFPGAGWLVLGRKPLMAVGWLIGAIGLTYVELSLQSEGSALYWPMFASVFVMNTAFAVDAWMGGAPEQS
ncbi:MAG: hypothetical protein KC621_31390 [Myxococcales bacterium]|nr:hypothetical protein [Myxococcales bacterium]